MSARRKGVAPLTRDQIVDAALALIDEQGLEATTMRRLGERLGVDASSLYHHVSNQAALFDLVADRIMGGIEAPACNRDDAPEEVIVAMCTSLFRAMTSHPRAVRLLTERPLRSALIGEPFEQLLGALYATGMTPTQALSANGILGWYIIGAAQNFASQELEAGYAEDVDAERLSEMSQGLPNFMRLMAEAEPPQAFEAEFEKGLRALVRGLVGDARPGKRTRR